MKKAELEKLIQEQKKTIEEQRKSIDDLKLALTQITSASVASSNQVFKLEPIKEIEEEKIDEFWKLSTPPDFRNAVDLILNKEFGIKIEPQAGSTDFEFTISVPQKYSNASPAYWQTNKQHLSTKVISRAEGLNGVKEWAELVFKSLGSDAQVKIALDRK